MKYEEFEDGEWVIAESWPRKRRGYKQACCDCGLVHIWDFRIVDGQMQLRVRRDERATAGIRRGMKRKLERGEP